MLQFINQRQFDRPETLLIARGADLRSGKSEIVSPSGEVLARLTNGGIESPVKTVLNSLTRLVRLGSGGLPHLVALGCWWIEWNQYKRVELFADQKGLSMPVAMRLLCCVPLEWNEMTIVIQARLKVPMLAYSGASAPVIQRNPKIGAHEFLSGGQPEGNPVQQLYIPGLNEPDMRHDCLMVDGYGHLPQELSRNGFIIRVTS